MFKKFLVVAIVFGALAGFAGVGSALFTDSAAVDANSFTTGTIDISTNPTTAVVTFSNMAPGDDVTAPIVIANDGSLELRYAVTSAATDADSKGLMSQLDFTIKSGVTVCDNAGFATDGTVVYATNDLGSLAGINVIGDPTTGAQAGDRVLAASANETLCFNVVLPIGTGNAYQDATTTATFTFAAEQTVNN
ncbi:spore coat-associated protein N [Thermoflexales bacterium]|nr:spore coat-associated protein N [Thermoflexales bacterium]